MQIRKRIQFGLLIYCRDWVDMIPLWKYILMAISIPTLMIKTMNSHETITNLSHINSPLLSHMNLLLYQLIL